MNIVDIVKSMVIYRVKIKVQKHQIAIFYSFVLNFRTKINPQTLNRTLWLPNEARLFEWLDAENYLYNYFSELHLNKLNNNKKL